MEARSHFVTYTQDSLDAVASTFHPLQWFGPLSNGWSVLSLAGEVQTKRFPWVLQHIAITSYPRMIVIDNIKDTQLLTLCLTATLWQLHKDLGITDPVIVYAGKLIDSIDVQKRVGGHINERTKMMIGNDTFGGDPWPAEPKSGAIFYHHGSFEKARWAPEGRWVHFEQDIHEIVYGSNQVTNQKAYYNVLFAITNRTIFDVNNDNMGGDAGVGVVKDCRIGFQDRSSKDTRIIEAKEGTKIDFKTWGEWFTSPFS